MLARELDLPRLTDGTPDGAALVALVEYCAQVGGELTTAGVMQHFADSGHDAVLAAALAAAEDHGLPDDQVAQALREGAARWRLQAQQAGTIDGAADATMPKEEAERLRQLDLVRKAAARRPPGDP